MPILVLAWKSLVNRRFTAALTVLSIALAVALLLGVERTRTEARESFAGTLSGTDLIVGPRSSPIQLLLATVFRIGSTPGNLSWESYRAITAHPLVEWSIPLIVGDSHRGFRVVGTSNDYFEHYRYGRKRRLAFAAGGPFGDVFDAVLGSEVARTLGYRLGDELVVSHGLEDVEFARHDDRPFRVAGILEPTGTPVDRTVHLSLQGVEAMHVDWKGGAPLPGLHIPVEQIRKMKLQPEALSGVLLGLRSRAAAFRMQRFVNEYRGEPLTAVLPGVALGELWSVVGVAENALLVVSGFVVVVGLFGMLGALLTSLQERRREMAILRSVGARPVHVFGLVMGEAGALTLVGALAGLIVLQGLLATGGAVLESRFGLQLAPGLPSRGELGLLVLVTAAGFLIGAIPAWRAYMMSLADGLSIRI